MKLDKSIQATLIISATILILALIIYSLFSSFNSSDTISVTGEATVGIVPDLVGIYFYVEVTENTSEEATRVNAEIVETLKDNLVAAGFDEDKLTTQSFNVYPNYGWDDEDRKKHGYVAVHYLKLELPTDNTKKIGQAIDAGVSAKAGIRFINFELSQELQNQYKAEAIKLAAEDAKIKAEALASGIGKKLGKLVSVSTSNYDYYPLKVYGEVAVNENTQSAKAATQITPSEQDVYASVNAVYKIE